jgi:hypothetical protein
MKCRVVTAACAPRTSSGRRPTSAPKKVRSPSGKPVIQLRLPIEDFSPIFNNEIPLHIVRLPIRAPASISNRSGQTIEKPMRAVEWILYPNIVIRIIRRRRHGKIKRSAASSLFILISQAVPFLQNLMKHVRANSRCFPAGSYQVSLVFARIPARGKHAQTYRADSPGASSSER